MADITTVQQIQGASLDAQALEKFINGSDSETVLTRLNAEYPTLQKAIKELFENGGLPATPFSTKAIMTASALTDGKYAIVTDDVALENNGLYVKTAGAWIKSKYDIIDVLYRHINESLLATKKTGDVISSSSIANILYLLDSYDQIVLSVGADGDIFIKDIDGSLQEYLQSLKASSEKQNIHNDIADKTIKNTKAQSHLTLVDDNDVCVLSVKNDGSVNLFGLEKSVQEYLRVVEAMQKNGVDDLHLKNKYTKHLTSSISYLPSFNAVIASAKSRYGSVAPIPIGTSLSTDNIGTTWINNLSIATDVIADGRVVAGYDSSYKSDIGVVHPNVWAFDTYAAGYKYWMAITPYTDNNEMFEVPYIYGTNNDSLSDWKLIGGFPAPFEEDPTTEIGSYRGHLSDPAITYDPIKGDIILFWRKSLFFRSESGVESANNIIRAARFDGSAWSENYDLAPLENLVGDSMLSPSIVYNPSNKLFYMYYIQGRQLLYRTAENLDGGGWSSPQQAGLTAKSGNIWHLDAKFVGDKLVMLLHLDGTMSNSAKVDDFYLAISSDFINFTVSTNSLVTTSNPHLYKASFISSGNNFDNNSLKIIYTSDSLPVAIGQRTWQLRVSETNKTNFGV